MPLVFKEVFLSARERFPRHQLDHDYDLHLNMVM